MRIVSLAAAVPAFALAGVVQAQEFKAGATVYGKAGEPVGAVVSSDADTLTVEAPDGFTFGLPKAGFQADGDRIVGAWTKAEIDAAVEEQRAAAPVKADASTAAAGAPVRSKDGASLGVVASTVVEADRLKTVMIKPQGEEPEYGLPGGAFTVQDGALVAAWTKAEIDQARGASAQTGGR